AAPPLFPYTTLFRSGEASDGTEAVALARQLLPDVVLMDLVMPELDGVEATRAIRTASPSTKVIVLTSFDDDEKVFPAIKAGAARSEEHTSELQSLRH